MEFKRPSPLKPGDKVAILSPSSGMPFLFPWVYQQGIERIKEHFNLQPIEFPTACQSPDYLSQHPKARADDVNRAFADPSIKAIIATIGGIDQIRMLPYLNEETIRSNPKFFMGYSDCTNLHLYLWNLGIISCYGGAVMTQFAMGGGMQGYTIDSIQKALFTPAIGPIHAAAEYSDADLDWADKANLSKKRPQYQSSGWHWHNSKDQVIQGRLWGGCLEVLDLHLGVRRYLPDFERLDGAILFIETSEEMPSEGLVYCFFSALAELGLLNRFQAILMAYPKAQFCGKQPPDGREAYIVNQQNAVKKALHDYDSTIPVVFNMNFGHTDPQTIIPSGGHVLIDCAKKAIRFI